MSEELRPTERTIPRRRSFTVYDKERQQKITEVIHSRIESIREYVLVSDLIIDFNKAAETRNNLYDFLESFDGLPKDQQVFISIKPIPGRNLEIHGIYGSDSFGDCYGKVGELVDGEEVTGAIGWDDRRTAGDRPRNGQLRIVFCEDDKERYIYLTSNGDEPDFEITGFGIIESSQSDK
jgi:hypothetical protein